MTHLPHFSLPCSGGRIWTDADFAAGTSVLYVYPRDMTPGCTLEAHDFKRLLPDFAAAGVRVVGLSRDDVRSHGKFCERESLTFPLIADPEMTVISALGLRKAGTMYGKPVTRIERATLLIRSGEIIRTWRDVSVPGHAEEVLAAAQNLKA